MNPAHVTCRIGPPPLPAGIGSGCHRAESIPKFCGQCGAAWQPEQITCASCAKQQRARFSALAVVAPDRAIHQALSLYFCLLALCGLHILTTSSSVDSFNFAMVVEILMSALVITWAAAQWRANLAGLLRVPAMGWFALALAMSLVTVGIGAWVITSIQAAFHISPARIATPFLRHGWGRGMVVLAVVVQPAIIEELAFRGIILGAMRRILGPFQAVIVSALMFMILHLSPARFPHTLALGLAAGFLRVRSKSLLPCFLLHFSHNFLTLAIEWTAR